MRLKIKTGESTRHGLAWAAFALGVIGGATATASWIGAFIVSVVGVFWWWLPIVLVTVVSMIVLGDLLNDGIPNRGAIYGAIVCPSLAVSIQGRLGDTMRGWIAALNGWLDEMLAEWITDAPRGSAALLTGISVATITFAIMYTRRYAARSPRKPRSAEPMSPGSPRSLSAGA